MVLLHVLAVVARAYPPDALRTEPRATPSGRDRFPPTPAMNVSRLLTVEQGQKAVLEHTVIRAGEPVQRFVRAQGRLSSATRQYRDLYRDRGQGRASSPAPDRHGAIL